MWGFVDSFRLLNLRPWLCVEFGTCHRSERAAHEAAMVWLRTHGVKIDSIRLGRLYRSNAASMESGGNGG